MRVDPRHMNELLNRLENVMHAGYCEVRKDELLFWYDQERLTIRIWRDIEEKWSEIAKQPLFVGGVSDNSDTLIFIWGEGLSDSEKSWFKNLNGLTKIGLPETKKFEETGVPVSVRRRI
jgi:hypothetical protein